MVKSIRRRLQRLPKWVLLVFVVGVLCVIVSVVFLVKYKFRSAAPVYKTVADSEYVNLKEIDKNIRSDNLVIIQPGRKALLPGAKWVPQTFNNCGPATTSMLLQYFGHTVDQNTIKAALRTNADDKNVFTFEIQNYLKQGYNIDSKMLYNGDLQTLKTLVANGFYILVEDWLHPNEDIGHVTLIRGFDDAQGVLIADDSYLGVNVIYRYEEFDKTQWKPFNREYTPIYTADKTPLLKAIIGENWDPQVMYQNAVERNKADVTTNRADMYAWFNLGTSNFGLEKYAQAAMDFEKSQKIGWPKRMLWYQIQPIQTYNRLGEYQKAIVLADIALVGNDSFAEAHVEKAIAYKGLGNVKKAAEEIQKALFYAPNLQSAKEIKLTDTSGDVLGVSYFGPVAGSPLIPPEVITVYFFIFFALLLVVYFFLHQRKKPVLLWHKIKLLFVVVVALKLLFIGGGILLTSYWLLPSPAIQTTIPPKDESNYGTTRKIEIIFDKPVSRSSLEKSIHPEVPGVWVFEDAFYTTHFYRKVTFYPTQSLTTNTTYTITLANIKNVLRVSKPYTHTFSFKTQKAPIVRSVTPISGTDDVTITTPIIVALSEENNDISEFRFTLDPEVPLVANIDRGKKAYTLTPTIPFTQGTKYTLTITKTDIILNIPTKTVIQRANTTQEYQGTFITKEAPGIMQFSPSENNVSPTVPVGIVFSQAMDRKSVEQHFSISPNVPGTFSWKDDQSVVFTPKKLGYETAYTVTIAKGAKAQGSGFFEQDVVKTFTTIGHVKVSQFVPKNDWNAVGISNQINVTFDQEVDKKSAESKFSITPPMAGVFSWDGRTMLFTPSTHFAYSTKYTVTIGSGVKTIRGLDSNKRFEAVFTTQEGTFKLAVPMYLQQHALSCEIAALRMALAYKGVQLSEETLLEQVGLDSTPHVGNTWGNPNNAFVGNVDGRQMVDGYGVHWNPIARVARMYRGATEFEGWNITQLTQSLSEGNAVVIWVYSSGGYPTSWITPDGQNISAYRDEHAVTAVGYVGPAHNPSQIIINDPLTGQVYWQRAFFDIKWNSFGRSGVVVL